MRTWILVGDSAQAKVYETDVVAKPWQLVRDFAHPESRAKGVDLLSDGSSHRDPRGALPHDTEVHRFVRELATFLETSESQVHFERLILVGGPKFLGELKAALAPRVHKRVSDTLAKDFTHLDAQDLLTRVQEFVRPMPT